MTSGKFHQHVSNRERFHVEAIAKLAEQRQKGAALPIDYDELGHAQEAANIRDGMEPYSVTKTAL